jgi:hypothetical protein
MIGSGPDGGVYACSSALLDSSCLSAQKDETALAGIVKVQQRLEKIVHNRRHGEETPYEDRNFLAKGYRSAGRWVRGVLV